MGPYRDDRNLVNFGRSRRPVILTSRRSSISSRSDAVSTQLDRLGEDYDGQKVSGNSAGSEACQFRRNLISFSGRRVLSNK
jgi:hypothetical protein